MMGHRGTRYVKVVRVITAHEGALWWPFLLSIFKIVPMAFRISNGKLL